MAKEEKKRRSDQRKEKEKPRGFNEEDLEGYGDKKLEGPDRPST
ncbi:hypothetical protein EV207_105133 [Scopulibacillus darangshiensis]|uniref:Uncharacterized protein n=1 Tax=Scopulibacillus darangshiensis TaxID=442528 RepID=A0A4R2P8T6_9BACL|nr:hypothetical protein [Scopulibacillus darangshiensis]TCP30604.1 hypothetical protein EV207_105133 [Scopulibacillus darangshiensis]